MSGYPRLDETGLNTLTEALADATKLQGVIKVCETEAEWNQKTQAEKDDPNTYWFLPWKTETSGEIDDSTTAPDKVWSSQKVNSENTALKAMVTDDYVFSPSKSYVAGDWFIYNNILYEVIVACTGVTPPNATYYNPITLHELKNRIDTLNSRMDKVVNVVSPFYIGKTIISARNNQLTFTNGIATRDISNIYNGSEAFGFFFFPYNVNEVGVMHVLVNNGVATFNTEGTTTQGQYYVNWMILLPRVSGA